MKQYKENNFSPNSYASDILSFQLILAANIS